ncbi:hypothetical protein H8L32_06490 [Undibacterium sp. CY18W]|uniref:Uncharacterized protein n=1 Tax=Undibacterium hunanense TaxID=2762292 RepID=A0ABR6ZMK7_9BURK|nr:hypothetical protein [Undibacterium hunanense]MBC3917117.1 hypothetical protein [Undibacterium hunanense]
MYTQIERMMFAEDASDVLVFHATNIANAIKRCDNAVFENRDASLKAVLKLLGQYVQQERAADSASKQPTAVAA